MHTRENCIDSKGCPKIGGAEFFENIRHYPLNFSCKQLLVDLGLLKPVLQGPPLTYFMYPRFPMIRKDKIHII